MLIGPGASRLMAIEEETKRRFLIVPREDVAVDHFEVLGKGTLESLDGKPAPVAEGKQLELKLVEVGKYDVNAGIGKLDGLSVCVGGAAPLVGKKAKVRIERVLNGTAYATLVAGGKQPEAPITAEGEAEKPTRKPPARKRSSGEAGPVEGASGEPGGSPGEVASPEPEPKAEAEEAAVEEPEAEEPEAEEPEAEEEAEAVADAPAKKKTRRGSRGGRRRRKKPAGATAETPAGAPAPAAAADGEGPKIHLPAPDLGTDEPEEAPAPEAAASENGEQPKPKKKTRRGSRGGRNRRRKSGTAAAGGSGSEAAKSS